MATTRCGRVQAPRHTDVLPNCDEYCRNHVWSSPVSESRSSPVNLCVVTPESVEDISPRVMDNVEHECHGDTCESA